MGQRKAGKEMALKYGQKIAKKNFRAESVDLSKQFLKFTLVLSL